VVSRRLRLLRGRSYSEQTPAAGRFNSAPCGPLKTSCLTRYAFELRVFRTAENARSRSIARVPRAGRWGALALWVLSGERASRSIIGDSALNRVLPEP
jgi:hypothetical protein